ncbi:sn-glycerol 3-phosphate transport system permease protein [Hamadaea flava]|uniref:Carbohydrate ABC transporter permease n=1 Tax=Hamadaea flava TaxID=1742688 RepID=A0ABV8LL79_9ACTN|nr:sugar ABC transporter permease [Hamadaea flava]MCP2324188.1 sn-glycerol 3-phosphate transport system permease protein [Hamadaea flava]
MVAEIKPSTDPPLLETSASEPSFRARRGRRRRASREAAIFLAFALPNLALIAVFTYRPLLLNMYYSTLDWTLGAPTARPVGLSNYLDFFQSAEAGQVFLTTAVFTLATVFLSMALGLMVALALNRRVRGAGLARATVFSPFVLSGVGVGLAWQYIFDPTVGALGAILRSFGIASPQWFNNETLSLVMVVLVYVWKNLGYAAVIYLAGLQSISSDVLEAAAIDGASARRKFFSVVLPLLSPTTFFLLVTSTLNSLQAFDLIRVMTPLGRGTTTLIYDAYLRAFGGYNQAGYSAMLSTVLFGLLVILTLFQLVFLERRVHYR